MILRKLLIIVLLFILCQVKALAEEINVAFVADNNYVLPNLLTINSILKNNVSNNTYNFYIIENNISRWNKLKIKFFVRNMNHQNVEFIRVNTKVLDNAKNLYYNTLNHGYISEISLAKMLIPEVIKKDIKKILYLDCDILVLSDLAELYNLDVGNNAALMATDCTMLRPDKGQKVTMFYCNSGVILINLEYWIKNDIAAKLVNDIRKNKFGIGDQTSINRVLKHQIGLLPIKWNNQIWESKSLVSYKDGGLIHFTGPKKPWRLSKPKTPEEKLYFDYWNKTPFVIYRIPVMLKNLYYFYFI